MPRIHYRHKANWHKRTKPFGILRLLADTHDKHFSINSRAAAKELGKYGITVNVVSLGAIQTGWITPDLEKKVSAETPLGRIGRQ